MGTKYLRRGSPGSNVKTAKLTEEDINPIRDRIANGEMLKDIAKDYGVGPTTIGGIKSGGTWSHVPREDAE